MYENNPILTTNSNIMGEQTMFKMTVKNRLMLAFLAILIIPCSAIGWFSYQSAAKQVAAQIEKNAAQSVEYTNNQINDLMSNSLIAVDYLAKNLSQNTSVAEINTTLSTFLGMNPTFENAHFATNSKEMYTMPVLKLPPDFDPTIRPWWEKAMDKKGTGIVMMPSPPQTVRVIS
jgi:methyl-accepting chemotaxis protein